MNIFSKFLHDIRAFPETLFVFRGDQNDRENKKPIFLDNLSHNDCGMIQNLIRREYTFSLANTIPSAFQVDRKGTFHHNFRT